MTKLFYLAVYVVFTLSVTFTSAQNHTDLSRYDCEPEFVVNRIDKTVNELLSGVKYALIPQTTAFIKNSPPYKALISHLLKIGFSKVLSNDDLNNDLYAKNLCDNVVVFLEWDDSKKVANSRDIKLHFFSECSGQRYIYETTKNNSEDGGIAFNTYNYFANALDKIYPHKKPKYDESKRLILNYNKVCWDYSTIIEYLSSEIANPKEGIYEEMYPEKGSKALKFIVKNIKGNYYLLYLDGYYNYENWNSCELLGTLEETAVSNLYKTKLLTPKKDNTVDFICRFKDGILEFEYSSSTLKFIKLKH